jgi:hypothetical protein
VQLSIPLSRSGEWNVETEKRTCKGEKPGGTRCSAVALPGSDFCFFHDPSQSIKRREAQAQGGRQNRVKTLGDDAPDVKLRNGQDLAQLLSQTINQVRKGLIDPRIANSVGYLSNILAKVVEQREIERRIERVEELLKIGRERVQR